MLPDLETVRIRSEDGGIVQNSDGRATFQYYIYTFILINPVCISARLKSISSADYSGLCQDGGMRPLNSPLS